MDASSELEAGGAAQELRVLVRYGAPIVLAQLGFLLFSVVDTYMVGHLAPGAVGGVGASNSVYWFLAMAMSGVLYALDPLTAQAKGRGDDAGMDRLLFQGLGMAAVLSVLFLVPMLWLSGRFEILGAQPAVLAFARPYFSTVFWSGPFFFFFVVLQRYWQARGHTREILAAVAVSNLVNVVANQVLIFGGLGVPAMGIRGAALATVCARASLMLCAGAWTLWHLARRDEPVGAWAALRPRLATYREILRLGLPVAATLALEYGLFSLATTLSTRLGAVAADAHQVAIVVISIAYMLPVGLGSTAAFRVGHLVGAGRSERALEVGAFYVKVAAASMAVVAIAMVAGAAQVYGFFGVAPEVVAVGRRVLLWVGALLVFDAFQVTVAGCLRGMGRTRLPAIANALGYYGVGLPLAVGLAFGAERGVEGLWIGLAAGVVAVSLVVGVAWSRIRPEDIEEVETS